MMINDVITYNDAIVDNTDQKNRKVILIDQSEIYIQKFIKTSEIDSELIILCKLMRKLNISSL